MVPFVTGIDTTLAFACFSLSLPYACPALLMRSRTSEHLHVQDLFSYGRILSLWLWGHASEHRRLPAKASDLKPRFHAGFENPSQAEVAILAAVRAAPPKQSAKVSAGVLCSSLTSMPATKRVSALII